MESCALQLPVPISRCFKARARRKSVGARAESGGSRAGSWADRFQVALKREASRSAEELVNVLKQDNGLDLPALYRSTTSAARSLVEWASPRLQSLKGTLDDREQIMEDFRRKKWPEFVEWNRWERWKDLKAWNPQRLGALLLYVLLVVGSMRGAYQAVASKVRARDEAQLYETYLESSIPDPTPQVVRSLRKMFWRDNASLRVRIRKEVLGPDGAYHHDPSFIGESAWEDDEPEPDTGTKENSQRLPWRERLAEINRRVAEEEAKEKLDEPKSRYLVVHNPDELKKAILEQKTKPTTAYGHGFWVARRWWKYRPKLPYFYFLHKVNSYKVKAAVYNPDMTKLYVIMKEGFPSEYIVDIPADPFLKDTLLGGGVDVDVMPRSPSVYALRAYAVLFPCLCIFYVIDRIIYRLRVNASEKLSDVLKMDTENLILPWDAEAAEFPSFSDVIVGTDAWCLIEEIGNYMRNPMKYSNKKVFLPRGILVHGPPGTGKTHLARAMARQMKLPFIFASGSEFGEGEIPGPQKVFELFFTARANAPSIVFIDEIDALAGQHVEEDAQRLLTFRQLLKELDGGPIDTEVDRFSYRQSVILVCATNRKEDLHVGFLEPGRIDRELYVGLPTEEQRIRIFDVHSSKFDLAEDVDFGKVVYQTKGYSGADIQNYVNQIALNARERGSSEICQQDLVDVLEKQLFEGIGVAVTSDLQKKMEAKVSPEIRRLIAVHEAGHLLLAHLFPRFDWHAFTHLLPAGKERAITVFYPPEELFQKGGTIGYVKAQMIVAHGGHCAEKLIFGDDTTDGWRDDLSKITAFARELTVHWSNPRVGLLQVIDAPIRPPSKKPRPPPLYPEAWNHPNSVLKPIGIEVSELVGREIQRYIDETEAQAMEGLVQNRHILEKLAEELERRIKMTGDEVSSLVQSMNPVVLPDLLWRPPAEDAEKLFKNLDKVDPRSIRQHYQDLDVYAAPLHRC